MNILQLTFDYGVIEIEKGKIKSTGEKTLWGTGSVEMEDDIFFINKKLVSNIVVVAGAWITNLSQKFNDYGYYIYRDENYRDRSFYDAFVSAKTEHEAENILQKYNSDLCNRVLLYLEEINSLRRSQGLDIIVFDLILTPTSWFTIKAALMLKKMRGIPLISTLHVNERALQQIESFQLPWSNLILKYDVLTKQESDFLIAKNRDILIDISQYNNNVLEINNDIIIKKDSFQLDRQNSVVYVGRLSFEKGLDRLLAIAKLLKDLNIDLHICGQSLGTDSQAEVLVEELKTLPNVFFYGFLDKFELAKVLSNSKVIILPSRTEVFNQAILEGAMLGCSPISTGVGAARSVILEKENIICQQSEKMIVINFIRRIEIELKKSNSSYHNTIISYYKRYGGGQNRKKKFIFLQNIYDKTKKNRARR